MFSAQDTSCFGAQVGLGSLGQIRLPQTRNHSKKAVFDTLWIRAHEAVKFSATRHRDQGSLIVRIGFSGNYRLDFMKVEKVGTN